MPLREVGDHARVLRSDGVGIERDDVGVDTVLDGPLPVEPGLCSVTFDHLAWKAETMSRNFRNPVLVVVASAILITGFVVALGTGRSRAEATQVSQRVDGWEVVRRSMGFVGSAPEIERIAASDQGRHSVVAFGFPMTVGEESDFLARSAVLPNIAKLRERLESDDPEGFAGIRVDQSAGGRVVIRSMNPGRIDRELVSRILGSSTDFQIEPAGIGISALRSSRLLLDQAFSELGFNDVRAWYVDEVVGRLVVEAAPGSSQGIALELRRILPDSVPRAVREVDSARQESTIVGGDGLSSCSAGAQVYADSIYGRSYYSLTAGHCANSGLRHCSPTCHGSALPFIAERGTSIYGTAAADVQVNFISVSSSGNAGLVRNWGNGLNYYVIGEGGIGSGYDVVGAVVCKSGMTSGTTCGQLSITGYMIRGSIDGILYVEQRVVSNAGSLPGDSGGVVFVPTQYGYVIVGGTFGGNSSVLIYSQISYMHDELSSVGAPFSVRRWWE